MNSAQKFRFDNVDHLDSDKGMEGEVARDHFDDSEDFFKENAQLEIRIDPSEDAKNIKAAAFTVKN